MAGINRQWRLASHPDGMPSERNWTLALGKQLVQVGEEPAWRCLPAPTARHAFDRLQAPRVDLGQCTTATASCI